MDGLSYAASTATAVTDLEVEELGGHMAQPPSLPSDAVGRDLHCGLDLHSLGGSSRSQVRCVLRTSADRDGPLLAILHHVVSCARCLPPPVQPVLYASMPLPHCRSAATSLASAASRGRPSSTGPRS